MANHQNTFQSCSLSPYTSFEDELISVSSCPIWENLDPINNSLRIELRGAERQKEVLKIKIIFLQSKSRKEALALDVQSIYARKILFSFCIKFTKQFNINQSLVRSTPSELHSGLLPAGATNPS